jgi:copper chaperone
MTDQEWNIAGMSCNHCVMAVRKQLAKLDGLEVKDAKVGSVRVIFDQGKVTPEQIQKAITEAGYSVTGHS